MISSLVLCIAALFPTSDVVSAPTKPTLQELVKSAETDPAAVVPLIIEGSLQLVSLPVSSAKSLGDTLEPFCDRAFFSPERLPGMERLGLVLHKIEKGENPTTIARKYKIGVGLLPYLNANYDDKKLRIGQTLKVLDLSSETLAITVARSHFRLTAWRTLPGGGHALVKFCTVGVGAPETPTPLGVTKITKRVLRPTWTEPNTNITYAPEDPGNVLGGYWIALDSVGINRTGIGFHGYTGAPVEDWISKGASHGCVRMLQKDVDRIFHIAIEGTSVTLAE